MRLLRSSIFWWTFARQPVLAGSTGPEFLLHFSAPTRYSYTSYKKRVTTSCLSTLWISCRTHTGDAWLRRSGRCSFGRLSPIFSTGRKSFSLFNCYVSIFDILYLLLVVTPYSTALCYQCVTIFATYCLELNRFHVSVCIFSFIVSDHLKI